VRIVAPLGKMSEVVGASADLLGRIGVRSEKVLEDLFGNPCG
jgi:hypothetical protein